MTDAQLRFSRTVLRNYGNMSSPTVMLVTDEVFEMVTLGLMTWG